MHINDKNLFECVYRQSHVCVWWMRLCRERMCTCACVRACQPLFMYTKNVSCTKSNKQKILYGDMNLNYMLVNESSVRRVGFALRRRLSCLPAEKKICIGQFKAIQSVLSCLCKISYLNLWRRRKKTKKNKNLRYGEMISFFSLVIEFYLSH